MRAKPGDRLIVDGVDSGRAALILETGDPDGSPPYVVRWLAGGHVTLVYPGPHARILPAEDPAGGLGPPAGRVV